MAALRTRDNRLKKRLLRVPATARPIPHAGDDNSEEASVKQLDIPRTIKHGRQRQSAQNAERQRAKASMFTIIQRQSKDCDESKTLKDIKHSRFKSAEHS